MIDQAMAGQLVLELPPAAPPAEPLLALSYRRIDAGSDRVSIEYDRAMGDYAMTLDGELVGWASTYHHAEVTLQEVMAELRHWTIAARRMAEVLGDSTISGYGV